jgi:hypothetical protein
MTLSITKARLIIFALYMESPPGVAGKSPSYTKMMWITLQHIKSIESLANVLPLNLQEKWRNYCFVWPHEDQQS